ncbi:uncharacterized protein LOC118761179 [Octopus sinensis]|uniref:Uncharacterized protein LOC118761179 n=1 Tax=Octopus sinensis TaxID=2607531 RepID=A0A7E6EIU5_9MOLL|nr:uncharacterized protein LOC118761179 [Octopus sinensis]
MLRINLLQIIFLFYISLKFGNGLEYLKYFFKIENCSLKGCKAFMTLDVDAFNCSKKCFETSACKSFVTSKKSPSCALYRRDSKDKTLMKVSETNLYQLRRSVPTKYRDGRCPLDLIYNTALYYNNDLNIIDGINYTQCLLDCEAIPNCRSFDYNSNSKRCQLSTKDHTTVKLSFNTEWTYTEINRELWNDFRQSHTLEELNSVGCGVRVFDSYYFVNKKEINDLTAFSTFTFKRNTFNNLVTKTDTKAHSVFDCSRKCLISSPCIAFSYSSNWCQLKKQN